MFWSKKSCMKKLRMVCDFWDELRLRIQSQAQRDKFPETKGRQSNTNEIIWLKKCLKKFRPKYYKRFVDDILKNLSIYNDFPHIPKAYLNIISIRNTETQSRFIWRRLYGLLRFASYYRLKLTIFFFTSILYGRLCTRRRFGRCCQCTGVRKGRYSNKIAECRL